MKVIVNDILINHVESGHPHGTPVIFIHGFPFNHTMWQPQIDHLPSTFRLIAYDVRGLGQSNIGNETMTLDLHVEDLIGLMDDLKIEKAVLVGLSMGGYISLRAVEKHPNRFLGLVLCDTKSENDTEEAKQKRYQAIQKIEQDGLAAYSVDFLNNALTKNTVEHKKEVVNDLWKKINENQVEGVISAQQMLASRPDTTASLKRINLPTLLMVGELDTITPVAVVEKLKAAIPNAEMAIVPNSGHFSNIENPQFFNERLVQFLKRFEKGQE